MVPWWVSALLVVLGLALAAIVLGRVASASTPARDVGVVDGRLRPCPDSPNCVSSEPGGAQGSFAVAPFAVASLEAVGSEGDPLAVVREVLAQQPRTAIVERSASYLRAEVRSATFGFVDDVEVRWDDDAGVAHVRSASRLGYGDLGVNRNRVERLRAELEDRTR